MQKIGKLAIVTTHPIQYYAPVFQLLNNRKKVEIKVFYSWGEKSQNKHDPGFEKQVEWDLPLLEGYSLEWVENTSSDPGSHHFRGIINPGLICQITAWKPDVLLVIGWAYRSHLQVLRHFKSKLPVYFRGDSTLLDEKSGLRTLLKSWLLSWVYSNVDHVFYAGIQNKKYFRKYGVSESRLSFTPHAVDNARFAADRSIEVLTLRSRLGLKDKDILILFAGKLEQKKDPHMLLNAFLAMKSPRAHLLFVGNGPLEGTLKSQVSNLSARQVDLKSDKVHFLDFQNQTQMPVIYQASDLFCLPSKGPGESWGLAINEAMACGKAILASDKVGCAYDLVREGENGLVFTAGDVFDLTEKLNILTFCKDTLIKYGKRSNEIIQVWNFEAIATAIEKRLMNEPQR